MTRLLIITLLLGAGCAAQPPTPDWDSEMSLALSARGKTLAEQGDEEAGKRLAEEALALAQASGSTAAQARSLALIAWIDRSYIQAEEAFELMAEWADTAEIWDLQLLLADLALSEPYATTTEMELWARRALGYAKAVIEPASDEADFGQRAAYEGSARHLAAVALRRLRDPKAASYQERQAALVLTLLPDDALPSLRLSVFQARGDDLALEGEYQAAFLQHVHAQSLAVALKNQPGELAAMFGRAGDLAGLGRLRDAAQMAETLAQLAKSRGSTTLARRSAQRGLAWLDAKDPYGQQPLRQALLGCLREIDQLEVNQDAQSP
ncbi:MAG: hypothetical protein ACI9EF_001012 [Pseudohongiellaceae bacterium]|jgi:hypothetical protein